MHSVLAGRPALYILLALLGQDRHGYEIMKKVEKDSGGEIRLGPATLYTTIRRLVDEGYIRHVSEEGEAEDARRRYYSLTNLGRETVAKELSRMDYLVQTFKRKAI